MVDALVFVALGTAAVGIVLWFVTNYHIRWTKRALQAYGEDARHRTEAFVARELQSLESSYVQHTKTLADSVHQIQEGIPESGTEHLEQRFDGLIADLKARFEQLPGGVSRTRPADPELRHWRSRSVRCLASTTGPIDTSSTRRAG